METVIIPSKYFLGFGKKWKYLIYHSLGECIGGSPFPVTGSEEFCVNIKIVKEPREYIEGEVQDFSSFFKVGQSSLYFERKYGGIGCKLLLKNYASKNVEIFVNETYLRLIRFKIDNLYPVGVHVTDLMVSKFIDNGDLLVHGASLYNPENGEGYLIIAPPDTGKTYSTYKLIQKGYKYLGEDLSYYNHETNELFCVPLTSTWGHRFDFTKINLQKVPFLGLFVESNKKHAQEIFGRDSLVEKAPLKRIYILEKSSANSITQIPLDAKLFQQIISVQRNEFNYFKNPLLRVAEYFDYLNVEHLYNQEIQNLRFMLKNKDIYLVRASKHQNFHELIARHEISLTEQASLTPILV